MRYLPNILTFLRILLIPVMIAAFYSQSVAGKLVAAIVFSIACITDFLDGFMSRVLSHSTKLGQFLDPIADKLLITSSLLMLAGFGHLPGWNLIPAIIILCREILISGLREFLMAMSIQVPVTVMAKWKTATQMLAVGFLLLGDQFFIDKSYGIILLWLAAGMTLFSAAQYLKFGLKYFN